MQNIKFIFILSVCIAVNGCALLSDFSRNYTNPSKPRYAETHKTMPENLPGDTLTIASFNIREGEKIDKAIQILKNNDLQSADILCLQEMDLSGVKTVADQLHYNYVYYPASVDIDKDFGPAVLTKWEILEDEKIILPHLNPNLKQRIAVRTKIKRGDKTISVYSVHLGVNITPLQRGDQTAKIIETLPKDTPYIIIAGDFNTFTGSNLKAVTLPLKEEGFEVITESIGKTIDRWFLVKRMSSVDHIAIKNFSAVDVGKIEDDSASDHIPVWATLKFQ